MVVFLIGFMGSGKSTLGKKLAKKLNFDFVDSDKLIENEVGLSIPEIFKERGETEFRKLETQFLDVLERTNCVVALGGGTPCHSQNIEKIKKLGTVVYIEMPANSLTTRLLEAKQKRPLIDAYKNNPKELERFVSNKLEERSEYYNQADIIFSGINITADRLNELSEKINLLY